MPETRSGVVTLKNMSTVIFWGALWGLAEATLGHLLHIWALPVGWLIWFPLAFGLMGAVYRRTKQPLLVFLTAMVASAVKLIDFLMPVRLDYVINPAVSIVLEGLAVSVAYQLGLLHGANRSVFWQIAAVSFLWRVLYCGYLFLMPEMFLRVSPLRGIQPAAEFFLLETAANALLIYGMMKMPVKQRAGVTCPLTPHPALSLGLLTMACWIQWIW